MQVGLGTRGFKVTDIQAVAQLIGSDESFFEGEDAVWKDPVLEAQVLKASAPIDAAQLIGLASRDICQIRSLFLWNAVASKNWKEPS